VPDSSSVMAANKKSRGLPRLFRNPNLERAKGFEPSTPTLAIGNFLGLSDS